MEFIPTMSIFIPVKKYPNERISACSVRDRVMIMPKLSRKNAISQFGRSALIKLIISLFQIKFRAPTEEAHARIRQIHSRKT
jgi:hypothetical protein